jgi:hypothetical protein
MNMIRIAIAGAALAAVMGSAAMAQTTVATAYGGSMSGTGPSAAGWQMTPLATVGDLAVGIWTRIPPSYDTTADYNGAANPLP